MSFIKALALAKQQSLLLKSQPVFQAEDLVYPFVSRVKTVFQHGRIDIIASEPIQKGEVIACLPLVFIPTAITHVSYKDSSSVIHGLTHLQMNSFNEDFSLFEFDMLYARYGCFYSANCYTSYKILNNEKLVLLSNAMKDIAEGECISLDLGAYFYESMSAVCICTCGHEFCPQQAQGFKYYSQEYKSRLIHRKYIDIACAAEYYADQWRSKTARQLIECHYLTQLNNEEINAFYYFYDQNF